TPRGIVLAGGLGSFVVALGLSTLVGSEFVPQTDQGFTQVNLRMPVASSLQRSNAKVLQIEEILAKYPEIKTVSTVVGSTGEGLSTGRNQAALNISLQDRQDRRRSQKQIEDAIRADIAKIPGVDVSVGFDRPIWITILGADPEVLTRVANEFAEKLKKIPGAVDVETTVKPGLPAFAVRLKDSAIRELGLTAPQVAASLRAFVNGDVATYWTTPDGNQVEVLLRLPQEQRQRIEQMNKLP
ncbi:efflux RND transporter permease subunit, partial [Roseateles sp. GG27B]